MKNIFRTLIIPIRTQNVKEDTFFNIFFIKLEIVRDFI